MGIDRELHERTHAANLLTKFFSTTVLWRNSD